MQNNNTFFQLVERIANLLERGQVDVVKNVAKRPQLNPRLGTSFLKLLDLITVKNEQVKQAAEVNAFYRIFINKILDVQQFDEEQISNQYQNISSQIVVNIIRLRDYVQSVLLQIHELEEQSRSEFKSFHEKMQLKESEIEELRRELAKLTSIEQQKKKHEETINIFAKEKLQLSQIITKESEESQRLMDELNQIKQEKQYLQSKLQTRIQLTNKLAKENQNLKQQLQNRQKEKQDLLEKIGQMENLRQSLNKKDQEINKLTEQINKKQLSGSKSFDYSSSIVTNDQSQVGNTLKGIQLIPIIERVIDRQIKTFQRLYNFKVHQKHNFHKYIENKKNILLLCEADSGVLVGGFTSASFSLSEEPLETKAFLFAIQEQEVVSYELKKGKSSIEYDGDFLIFGNEELSLESGKCQVTSYITTDQQERHYQRGSERQDLLWQLLEPQGKLHLKNYEIFQVVFLQ